jgi:hypothetical protein
VIDLRRLGYINYGDTMNWASIIAAVMEILGPILMELIKEWLDGLLNRAKHRLPSQSTTDPYAAQAELWIAAFEVHEEDGGKLWWWQLLAQRKHARRGRFLERARAVSLTATREGRAPTAMESSELRSLAQAAA